MSKHATTLKPCPFCGGSARMEFMEGDAHWKRTAAVSCRKCQVGTLFDHPKSARALWNSRVELAVGESKSCTTPT